MTKINPNDERDRNIAGLSADDLAPEPVELEEIGEDIVENPDGSVTITDDEVEEESESGFSDNLVLTLERKELTELSSDLLEKIERDKEARKKRDEQYADGLKRSGLSGDAPGGADFNGASKAVHPILAEASVDFASAAIKELFPPDGPAKTKLRGKETDQKKLIAKRKANYLNWQLTRNVEEYRDELEQLLSQLPMGGSQYKKWRYDEGLGRASVEFVPVDEVFLPYASTNFYTAPRVTHRQLLTKSQFEERVESGLYEYDGINTDDSEAPELSESAQINDDIEGKEETCYNEDGLREVFEIYTWRKLDDPLSEKRSVPYIITIDAETEKVLCVYRNWKEGDERFKKLDWWVDYGFIPWRGAYKLGLPHLIGGLAIALTGSLRALLDSAHINNAPTMLKLKAGRISGQTTSIDVTQVQEIEGPAGITDIRQLAMAMPFNPPSPVLFQLLGWLTDAAKGVVTTAEEKIANASNNMPVGTTLALIEQGSKVASAIHARLHASQQKSMEILCRINSVWFDEELAREVFGEDAPTREDFLNSDDIQPVSDPNVFSDAQRFAKWQALQQMSLDPSLAWNKNEIAREGLLLMKVDDPDRFLPPVPKPEMLEPVEENIAATLDKPLKVYPTQDDLMHIASHLKFATSPIVQITGLVMPTVPALLAHVKEHIMQYYREHSAIAAQTAEKLGQARGAEAQTRTSDLVMMAMSEELQSIMPLFQQAQQLAAQAAQQAAPQLDPQSQVALQLGQAEIARKAAYDQAAMGLKQAELAASQQLDSVKLQQEQQAAQFEAMLKAQAAQAEEKNAALAQQVELLKNEADNKYKQITDLMVNKSDNDTNVIIEQMRQQLDSMQGQVAEAQRGRQQEAQAVDTAPIIQQLQATLQASQAAEAQDKPEARGQRKKTKR